MSYAKADISAARQDVDTPTTGNIFNLCGFQLKHFGWPCTVLKFPVKVLVDSHLQQGQDELKLKGIG